MPCHYVRIYNLLLNRTDKGAPHLCLDVMSDVHVTKRKIDVLDIIGKGNGWGRKILADASCQELQRMHDAGFCPSLLEPVRQLHHAAGTAGNHSLGAGHFDGFAFS